MSNHRRTMHLHNTANSGQAMREELGIYRWTSDKEKSVFYSDGEPRIFCWFIFGAQALQLANGTYLHLHCRG